jgi:thymidylate synthase (FAD)
MIKVELLDHMGSDLSVVNAARVSFDKESSWEYGSEGDLTFEFGMTTTATRRKLSDKDQKLIHYLAKHKHISPFGHCFLSFRVTAPVFVARQLVKHKFLRWNEVSRRYVDSEPYFYAPEVWRKKADSVKQGSSSEPVNNDSTGYLWWLVNDQALTSYKRLLSLGVCPEQARMVLPQSMMTSWIWSGSLDAFIDMCRLRLDKHTQYETRMVAEGVAEKIAEHFPISWQALYGEEANAS